jgi:hypothetical protein
MICVALAVSAGIYTWLIFAVMLSPYFALWYFVLKRRMLNYFKLLLESKPYEWNVEKALAEYVELLDKKQKP